MDMQLHTASTDDQTIALFIEEMTRGFDLEPWIVQLLEYPLNLYQAAGLLLRFGCKTTDRSVAFQAIMEGRETPVSRVASWVRTLTDEQLGYVEWLLDRACDQTLVAFEDLDSGDSGWSLCTARDDMENLHVVLRCARRPKSEAVQDLDGFVTEQLQKLNVTFGEESSDSRLHAAALDEPDIWWGC